MIHRLFAFTHSFLTHLRMLEKRPLQELKHQQLHWSFFREQLNIKGVGVASSVELTSGMEFVWKRAENRRPVLGFACYASREKTTNRDTSALGGNWRDPSGPCLGAVGFACRRIICTDCFLPAHIYKPCVPRRPADPSCQTWKAEASEARASFSDMHCTFPVTGPWGSSLLVSEAFSDVAGRCVTSKKKIKNRLCLSAKKSVHGCQKKLQA